MEKIKFVDGKITLVLDGRTKVFITCNHTVFIKQVICDSLFMAHKIKAGNSSIELEYGTYEVTTPNNCPKNCFVCLLPCETPPAPVMMPSSINEVCIQEKSDDIPNPNEVIRAWSCLSCKGGKIEISLHDLSSGEKLDGDYEVL